MDHSRRTFSIAARFEPRHVHGPDGAALRAHRRGRPDGAPDSPNVTVVPSAFGTANPADRASGACLVFVSESELAAVVGPME